MKRQRRCSIVSLILSAPLLIAYFSGCGKAKPLTYASLLGDAVVAGGGIRTDGSDSGLIYQVTSLYTGVGNGSMPGWVAADYPFINTPNPFGVNIPNALCPFYFTYTYPPNNYRLSDAHLVIDTQRDPSDTEGIFVNGVFTGRPPAGQLNLASTKVLYPYYQGNAPLNPPNLYYMDYSLAHYTIAVRQTFDIGMMNILPTGTLTIHDVTSTGNVQVVTGDDSPVFQAYLVLTGYTISTEALTCSNTSNFTYTNQYVHNDGNSISQAAFNGTVETPFVSTTSAVVGFKSIEFYFDQALPRVNQANISVSASTITMTIARDATATAIVVSGIGVSDPGFDQTQATSSVTSWYAAGQAYWASVLAGVPTNKTPTAVSVDLSQLLGSAQLLTLMEQGKLNIAVAGGIRSVAASGASTSRTYGVPISGPNFNTNGTYFNTVCNVPNNPNSPIQDTNPPPSTSSIAPNIYSVTVSEITSTSAVISWLTDQATSTLVNYGIGQTNLSTTLDPTPNTFHSVTLSGLTAFKFYYATVTAANQGSGTATSPTKVFRTLR